MIFGVDKEALVQLAKISTDVEWTRAALDDVRADNKRALAIIQGHGEQLIQLVEGQDTLLSRVDEIEIRADAVESSISAIRARVDRWHAIEVWTTGIASTVVAAAIIYIITNLVVGGGGA